MPRPRPLYVEMRITRHGRKVWYFRRSRDERRIRLPDVYGSQEFTNAYQVCLAGGLVHPAGKRGASRGKLAWLIELYMKSGKWASYRPATRKARGHILQKLAEQQGAVDVEDIDRAAIVAAVEKRRGTPEQANVIVTALKQMFAWGVEAGHVDRNPAEGVKGVKKPKAGPDEEEGHKTWTEEDLARVQSLLAARNARTPPVLGALLHRLAHRRRRPVFVQHVQRDGTIKLRNEKTGALVELPILQSLRRRSCAVRRGLLRSSASSSGVLASTLARSIWAPSSARRARRLASRTAPLTGCARPRRSSSRRRASRSTSSCRSSAGRGPIGRSNTRAWRRRRSWR